MISTHVNPLSLYITWVIWLKVTNLKRPWSLNFDQQNVERLN
jgi:hypothetical protein